MDLSRQAAGGGAFAQLSGTLVVRLCPEGHTSATETADYPHLSCFIDSNRPNATGLPRNRGALWVCAQISRRHAIVWHGRRCSSEWERNDPDGSCETTAPARTLAVIPSGSGNGDGGETMRDDLDDRLHDAV